MNSQIVEPRGDVGTVIYSIVDYRALPFFRVGVLGEITDEQIANRYRLRLAGLFLGVGKPTGANACENFRSVTARSLGGHY
jgi:hypothetical protein